MDSKIGHEFRNCVHNFFNNHNVNFCITAAIGITATYFAFVTILGQDLLHPLTIKMVTLANSQEIAETVMALVILWLIASAVGKIFNLFNLPFVFGAMLVGVIVGNLEAVDKMFKINENWDLMARRLALSVMIVRWGLSLRLNFVLEHWKKVFGFAFSTSIVEMGIISLAANLLFKFDWGISIILGAVLSAASSPVVMPVMIDLCNAGLGQDRKLTQIIPAISGVDQLVCLTVFIVTSTCVFTADTILASIVILSGKVALCAIGGIFAGLVLWYFPKPQEGHTVFGRGFLLLVLAIASINGMFYFGCGYAGIVFVLLLTSVACLKWRKDNPGAMFSVEKNYLYIWNFIACPILFVLVGIKLKLTVMSWYSIGTAVALIVLGFLFRVVGGLLVTSCFDFKFREQLVIVLSLAPKATLQGALGPTLIQTVEPFPERTEDALFVVSACLMSVLITAPLGRLLLAKSAPSLLSKSFAQTVQIAPSSRDETTTTAEEQSEHGKVEDHLETVTFKQFRALHQQPQKP